MRKGRKQETSFKKSYFDAHETKDISGSTSDADE